MFPANPFGDATIYRIGKTAFQGGALNLYHNIPKVTIKAPLGLRGGEEIVPEDTRE
jgi:hypothetical protein